MPKQNIIECSDLNTADSNQAVYNYNENEQKDQIITIELGSPTNDSGFSYSFDEKNETYEIQFDSPQPPPKRKAKKKLHKGDVKVKPIFDLKKTKAHILANWSTYDPQKVVLVFLKYYKNLRSCAVMLSRFKKQLGALKPNVPQEYLKQICLNKQQYADIRRKATEARQKEAVGVRVIENSDDILQQAIEYICSSDPKLLLAGIFPLTGLRPIEVAKIALFRTKLNNSVDQYSEFWACQTQFAKRRISGFNDSRDRCFLVPFWLIERALEIIRKRWPCENLPNMQVNRKYATHWSNLLRRAYPMFPQITAKLCRRFFVAYAYPHFKSNKGTRMSLNAFASHHLGHVCLADQVIANSSLCLEPAPTLDIFAIGRTLRVRV